MAHAQKQDFVFQSNGRFHLNRRGASVLSNTGSRGVRISGSNAGYTMCRGRVQDYWLPTPFACFPFTSPSARHRVPSHFNWSKQLVKYWPIEVQHFDKVDRRYEYFQSSLARRTLCSYGTIILHLVCAYIISNHHHDPHNFAIHYVYFANVLGNKLV